MEATAPDVWKKGSKKVAGGLKKAKGGDAVPEPWSKARLTRRSDPAKAAKRTSFQEAMTVAPKREKAELQTKALINLTRSR